MSEVVAAKCLTYELRQKVRIRGTEITALVQGVLLNEAGTSYQVSYWYESIRRVEWVWPEELNSC